jgi:hypothetical protein
MEAFNKSAYGPTIAALITDRLPELGPGSPNRAVEAELAGGMPGNAFGAFGERKIVDYAAASCCLSALWLWNNFLDESHEISQEINSIDGSYWHGIMHRRERDYGNAKYWFRRVPQHPIFDPLAAAARELAAQASPDAPATFLAEQEKWDPHRFVDLCEAIARGRSKAERLSREIARVEWQLLFDHCFRQAVGYSAGLPKA